MKLFFPLIVSCLICGVVTFGDDITEPVSCVLLGSVRLNLGLPILFVIGLLGQVSRHGGCLHHCFEAALSLLDVLLRVENDDVDLGYVEHAQRHGGAQAHGHCQGCGLDEHLEKTATCQCTSLNSVSPHQSAVNYSLCQLPQAQQNILYVCCYNAVFTVFI